MLIQNKERFSRYPRTLLLMKKWPPTSKNGQMVKSIKNQKKKSSIFYCLQVSKLRFINILVFTNMSLTSYVLSYIYKDQARPVITKELLMWRMLYTSNYSTSYLYLILIDLKLKLLVLVGPLSAIQPFSHHMALTILFVQILVQMTEHA